MRTLVIAVVWHGTPSFAGAVMLDRMEIRCVGKENLAGDIRHPPPFTVARASSRSDAAAANATHPHRLRSRPTDLESSRSVAATTEITVLGGDRYRVAGAPEEVERSILDAARGSIMELAWFIEERTGERIGINPECVVMLRAPAS